MLAICISIAVELEKENEFQVRDARSQEGLKKGTPGETCEVRPMFWTSVLKILGDGVTASWMSYALFGYAVCATLWSVVNFIIEQISERAVESRTRQNLRIYLDNCRREAEGRHDANPAARSISGQSAQTNGPSATVLGFKEIGVPNSKPVEAGLVIFDAILARGTGPIPSFDLGLPGCVMTRRAAGPVAEYSNRR